MSKPPIRNWLKRLKKTDPEPPYEPPIWFGDYSNGEFYHRATRKERLMRKLILKEGAERARYYGLDRREFMASGLGMTLTMSVMNLVNGCSSNGEHGGMNPHQGAQPSMAGTTPGNSGAAEGGMTASPMTTPMTGMSPMSGASSQMPIMVGPDGTMMDPQSGNPVPAGSPGMPGSMDMMGGVPTTMPDDPIECDQLLSYPDMFIFDIQTHRVDSAPGIYRSFLQFLPQARSCSSDVLQCYTKDEYIREMFLESDTTMAVLSGIPAVDGANPLTNEQIAESRDYINSMAEDSQRMVSHAMVLPNYNHEMQLDGMSRLAQDFAPIGAWKCYTPWGPGDGVTGFWLDDPQIGIPFIERGREVGVKVFCCHKGLPLPGFDNNYGDPKDIGVVAAMFPDTNFVVYHSAYQFGSADETQPYTMGSKQGVNSLVTACIDNGIGPGMNVYGELGSTWYRIMRDTRSATHVLGKLLKYLGEDNVVWGTDSIWYGTPQPQIQTFMSFKMDQQIRESEGYPELTPEVKAKIMGLNSAKVYSIDPMRTRCGFDETKFAVMKRHLDSEYGAFRWAFNQPRMTTRRDFLMHDRLCRFLKTPG